MNKQRTLVLLAFSCLLIVATIIGCTTATVGTGWPGGGGVSRFAFVVNSHTDSNVSGVTISAYTVDATTGALTAVAGSPFSTDVSGGSGTMWIDVDPSGRFLYVPNRGAATVSVFGIDSTGKLSEIAGSPFASGGGDAFVVEVHPNGRFVYVSNRSSVGSITAFSVGTDGTLTSLGTVGASNTPRHLFLDPQGRFLYASDESEGDVIDAYSIKADGTLTPIPGMPFGNLNCPRSGRVDDSGKFLLVANRCSSSISVFSIAQDTGALTEIAAQGSPFATGSEPFGVVEVPSGSTTYMAVNNLGDSSISVYSFDGTSGKLTPVSDSPFTTLGLNGPHYMSLASGKFGYIVNQSSDNITGVTVDAAGKPAAITGSPFSGGGISQPSQILFSR